MTVDEIIKHLREDSGFVKTSDGDHYRAAIAKLRAAEELANRILCRPYEAHQPVYDLAKNFKRAGEG